MEITFFELPCDNYDPRLQQLVEKARTPRDALSAKRQGASPTEHSPLFVQWIVTTYEMLSDSKLSIQDINFHLGFPSLQDLRLLEQEYNEHIANISAFERIEKKKASLLFDFIEQKKSYAEIMQYLNVHALEEACKYDILTPIEYIHLLQSSDFSIFGFNRWMNHLIAGCQFIGESSRLQPCSAKQMMEDYRRYKSHQAQIKLAEKATLRFLIERAELREKLTGEALKIPMQKLKEKMQDTFYAIQLEFKKPYQPISLAEIAKTAARECYHPVRKAMESSPDPLALFESCYKAAGGAVELALQYGTLENYALSLLQLEKNSENSNELNTTTMPHP